jgi:uncharacterized protein (DUF302 family)
MNTAITSFRYGRAVTTAAPFERAIELAKAFLKDEGFGVLCEIDVTATMKDKLGETFRPYRILGACNPHLAHKALTAESQLGLMLPCNVVVQVEDGRTVVSAIDATAMMGVVGHDGLAEIADDANARLGRVLERIACEPAS